MSETKIYQLEKDRVFKTGESNYLKGDRVKTGEILRVTNIGGTFEGLATTEYVELGFWNGHAYVPVKKGKPAEASDFINWTGNLWLREQQYVYAYFKDVDNDEKMKLRAEGKYE